MRTRVIPAQITTVEDKIAGNLNMTQMFILMVPVLLSTVVYALLPPSMKIVWYKLAIFLFTSVICAVLSLRIKGKVVLNWFVLLLRFYSRPKYYVFDKNDTYLRTLYLPEVNKKTSRLLSTKMQAEKKSKKPAPAFGVQDLVRLEELVRNKKLHFRYKPGRKGGLRVAFEEVSKKG